MIKRTRKTVITRIIKALDPVDYIGLNIEPIATSADPKDEVDADYIIRVMLEYRMPIHDGKHTYAAPFTAGIKMLRFQTMSNQDFAHNMIDLCNEIKAFARELMTDDQRIKIVTRTGIKDIATVISDAEQQFNA